MSSKKKIAMVIGPLLLSFILVVIVFMLPLNKRVLTDQVLEDSATALNKSVYKGNTVLNQAMSDKKFIPFLGASELSRFDAFHPSVLAEKYNRSYRPFLLGLDGTTLLNHYGMLNSLEESPKSGKIVMIVALASFEDTEYQNSNFSNSYSEQQTIQWLSSLEKITDEDKVYAKHLLKMPKETIKPSIYTVLKNVVDGRIPSSFQKLSLAGKNRFNTNVETIFGPNTDGNPDDKQSKMYIYKNGLKDNLKLLPDTYEFHRLSNLSTDIAKESTSANNFKIYNPYYKRMMKKAYREFDNKYRDREYVDSKGFADLELVLSEIAERDLDAYFILPTMHPEWIKHTGLPKKSIDDLNAKLTEQLTSQGFNNILDMNQLSGDYLMQDPLHIGWKGWMEVDKALKPFLEGPKNSNLNYQLDDKYYSDEWKNYRP